jgi:aryl-alcohol dehydrogenase-like predicted oxidoreductase
MSERIGKRKLGALEVSEVALGCMAMSEFYGPADRAESLETIHRALDIGVTYLDTAVTYGNGHNEELLSEVLATRRHEAVVATKFGVLRNPDGSRRGTCGKPDFVRKECENSLRRLKIDTIDLYFQHRPDFDTPIEETVGALAKLVAEGKVRHIGLSEISGATLRRAHAVHPIASVQSEYSLWCREPEQDILPACRELGVGFVAYSPLGRGFLTGRVTKLDDLAADDFRRTDPRFQPGNAERNAALVDHLAALAALKRGTPAQVALAWLLAKGNLIVPLFGTRNRVRLQENAAATSLHLSAEEVYALDRVFDPVNVSGERYNAAGLKYLDRPVRATAG